MVKQKDSLQSVKEIGSLNNLITTFGDLMFSMGIKLGDDKRIFISEIEYNLNNYMAARECYEGDTSTSDELINWEFKTHSGLAKKMKYNPIINKNR